MRRKFVAGNWKMHGSLEENKLLITQLLHELKDYNAADVAVFPSYIYLQQVKDLISGNYISLGAQNICEQEKGAYTGEVAAYMLKDLGLKYVLVGHSERRTLYNETNNIVAHKFALAQKNGLIPVLCIGETRHERENNQTENVIAQQLDAIINNSGVKSLSHAIIAYEPVWAIGTGLTASPEQAQEVHKFIRERISTQDKSIAANACIVYGGSVKGSNAKELFSMPDIDGGLIGGASLKAEEFVTICKAI